MQGRRIEIIFDNPTVTYTEGSDITGKVVVFLRSPMKVKGVSVVFMGYAKVLFYDYYYGYMGSNRRNLVSYTAKEEYSSKTYFLIGSANGSVEIPPGNHDYPFSVKLPRKLPSSFKSNAGFIKYFLTASLVKPVIRNESIRRVVVIVANIDLNCFSNIKEPVEGEVAKRISSCLCCKSGTLTLTVSIPYGGYTPGQNIPIDIEAENGSTLKIRHIKCKLIKRETCIANRPVLHAHQKGYTLLVANLGGIPPKQSSSFHQNVKIPANLPVFDLEGCSIIKIEFFLQVDFFVDFPPDELAQVGAD